MVIIEVEKSCENVDALLGAHSWNEFLRQPESHEANIQSRILYSKLNKGRDVQKSGGSLSTSVWLLTVTERKCAYRLEALGCPQFMVQRI
jgi:hypothetical protein